MKIGSFRILLVLLFVCLRGAVSGDFHAIVIADTVSPTGKAASLDLERVRQEFGTMARYIGTKVHLSTFSGEQVTTKNIVDAVQALPVKTVDGVIFYYLGHGYRTSQKNTVWPFLYLCNECKGLDLNGILEAVIAKRPRMALIVADCCNNVMDDEGDKPWEKDLTMGRGVRSPERGYSALFKEFNGIVVICAAKSGDYAYCHSKGHCYTEAFLQALREEVLSAAPQWPSLLNRAGLKVEKVQVPYHEILYYP